MENFIFAANGCELKIDNLIKRNEVLKEALYKIEKTKFNKMTDLN